MKPIRDLLERWKSEEAGVARVVQIYQEAPRNYGSGVFDQLRICIGDLEAALQECESGQGSVVTLEKPETICGIPVKRTEKTLGGDPALKGGDWSAWEERNETNL